MLRYSFLREKKSPQSKGDSKTLAYYYSQSIIEQKMHLKLEKKIGLEAKKV